VLSGARAQPTGSDNIRSGARRSAPPARVPKNGVRLFALDSNYVDDKQLDWLGTELAASGSDWKNAFFHHPLYSSGETHGSADVQRELLEPLLVKHGVDVVITGRCQDCRLYRRTLHAITRSPQEGAVCRALAPLHDDERLPHETFSWDYETDLDHDRVHRRVFFAGRLGLMFAKQLPGR